MKNDDVQNETSVSPQTLSARLARGAAADLLDVRTQPEHAAVHIPGVRLLPLDQLDPASFLRDRGETDRPLYVICQSGGRAVKAIAKFKEAGFNRCVLLEGGTEAWIAAGLPVERGESRVLPIMRQVQIVVGILSATGAALALWVDPRFAYIPLVIGCGLLFAGVTGFCGLAVLLARMPWNRGTGCDSGSCCTK